MLCLKCGVDNPSLGPACVQCGFFIGYVADGRGFLPQLQAFQKGQREGTIAPGEVQEGLQRLDQALNVMTHNVDQTGAGLASMGLDETQTGVLGGFLFPMRDAMEKFHEEVKSLEADSEIPDETLAKLEALQLDINRGSEGVAYLIQTLHGFLVEKVAAGEQLEPLPTQPPGE